MLEVGPGEALLASLQRPDLGVLSAGRSIRFDPALDPSVPFRLATRADASGAAGPRDIVLGPSALAHGKRVGAFHLRHAVEQAVLLDPADDDAGSPVPEPLARFAAARVAALFWRLDGTEAEADPAPWVGAMAAADPPDDAALDAVGRVLGLDGPHRDAVASLRSAWTAIGPVETLLADGGDARLRIDPVTRLNGYGCSHRPRPWAVTYASSTASSLSERGFARAEASRRRLARARLAGRADAGEAEIAAVRAAIARHYGLPVGTGIVLTASGTDCDLFALAIVRALGDRPVLNVVTAPEETGSGVPLAAVGRHFAEDTARGVSVARGTPVDGLPADTERVDLAVRRPDGTLLPPADIDAAASRCVADGIGAGRHVLLHLLDVSKTGLLAPSVNHVARLARDHRGRIDVVVDACQARLSAERVRSYVEIGWTVLLTGSKFFTGPPFCGAILLPSRVMAGLHRAALPAGLAAYSHAADWPDACGGRGHLPGGVNNGMVLRWQAAIAEMQAFAAVPGPRKREIITRFTAAVRDAIDRCPDLVLVDAPPLVRPVLGDARLAWDDLQTIIPFLVLGPDGAPLDLADTRRLYRWLNADLRACLPPGLGATERFLAELRCHLGQPAPVADGRGGIAGALRISAGARLVSGEPSHAGIDGDARVAREIADAQACIDKLSLLLRHRARLAERDPPSSFGTADDH